MRKSVLVFIVVVAAVILWLPLRKPPTHRMSLTTFLRNGKGLRAGARVRVDGVEAGLVSNIRVRPELGDYPVEVKLALDTPYDLPVPNDSIASLATEGLLGPTFVEIDTHRSQGPRLGNDGVLKSSELASDPAGQALNRLTDTITALDKKLDDKKPADRRPATPGQTNATK